MKKLFIAAAALLLGLGSAGAKGGLFDFGAKGGINIQRVRFSHTSRYDNGAYGLSASSHGGFHLGMISRINLPLFHIQPEILFTNEGYRITSIPQGQDYGSKSIVRLRTVDVPVLAGMRMMWIRLQAGPMFTVMSEAKTKDRDLIREVRVSKPSVSYLVGLGVDVSKFNLDVRYNGNLAKTTQYLLFRDQDKNIGYKSRNRHWVISVGYMF